MPSSKRKLNGPRCSSAPGYVQLEFAEGGKNGTPYGACARPPTVYQLEFREKGRGPIPFGMDHRMREVVDFLRMTLKHEESPRPTVKLLSTIATDYGITEGDAMRAFEKFLKGVVA